MRLNVESERYWIKKNPTETKQIKRKLKKKYSQAPCFSNTEYPLGRIVWWPADVVGCVRFGLDVDGVVSDQTIIELGATFIPVI